MDKTNKTTETPMPQRLLYDIDEAALKLLKANNEVFEELVKERKNELTKEYIKYVKKGIEEYQRLYDEVKSIKEDKPAIVDLQTGTIISKAGITLPLLESRNKKIEQANFIVEVIKQAKLNNYEPIIKWFKSFKDNKPKNNDQ